MKSLAGAGGDALRLECPDHSIALLPRGGRGR